MPADGAVQDTGSPAVARAPFRVRGGEDDGRVLQGAPRLVLRCARRCAYSFALQDFAKHVGEKGPDPGWDVQNGDVPFEKLFLLELRHVEKDCFQAVLSYDAD